VTPTPQVTNEAPLASFHVVMRRNVVLLGDAATVVRFVLLLPLVVVALPLLVDDESSGGGGGDDAAAAAAAADGHTMAPPADKYTESSCERMYLGATLIVKTILHIKGV
jgi:hypothetical protein